MLLALFFLLFLRLFWGTLARVQGLIITLPTSLLSSAVAGHAVSVGAEYIENACATALGSDRIGSYDYLFIIIIVIVIIITVIPDLQTTPSHHHHTHNIHMLLLHPQTAYLPTYPPSSFFRLHVHLRTKKKKEYKKTSLEERRQSIYIIYIHNGVERID